MQAFPHLIKVWRIMKMMMLGLCAFPSGSKALFLSLCVYVCMSVCLPPSNYNDSLYPQDILLILWSHIFTSDIYP